MLAATLAVATALATQPASAQHLVAPKERPRMRSHLSIVRSVANMVGDRRARKLVGKHGLQVLNVLWEDTGRYQGSSVGPNISDVTIEVQVEGKRGHKQKFLMPVIRYPNFSDKTGDVKIDELYLRVGNEREGREMKTITLAELLKNPTKYMSLPKKGKIKGGSLYAKRDTHALVSAQHAFLPIRQGTKATFWPVIFNYQSYEDNPAVLTILVTRQGTSMTIIDNSRDTVDGGGSWGQRLFFNKAGKRAPLTAERLADVKATGVTSNGEKASSLGEDANMLMLIQVPLKVNSYGRGGYAYGMAAPMAEGAMGGGAPAKSARSSSRSDVDQAVLGHGKTEGPYTELAGLTIERDKRFPVRVTIQFYQATSNGVINETNVAAMAKQIKKVYASADYVGSLVVPNPEDLTRPTNWDGVTRQPHDLSWRDFPGLVERWTKYGREGIRWPRGFVAF